MGRRRTRRRPHARHHRRSRARPRGAPLPPRPGGRGRDLPRPRARSRSGDALGRLDRFLRAVVAGLAPGDALVVASDHGNVEDLSTRNHTLAPVPVLGFGRAAPALDTVGDLTHLAPLLLGLCGVSPALRTDGE
ncbi:hypothetical protein [Anaeromyxobacter oryzae]|uniref:hypothetical protein n=1 Tax=Anaeromyxobacter oryzae TaxID=2918170 RepID=UPI00384DEE7B